MRILPSLSSSVFFADFSTGANLQPQNFAKQNPGVLAARIEEPPFVGQKDLARVEIAQGPQAYLVAGDALHPPVRNQELAEGHRIDHLAPRIGQH